MTEDIQRGKRFNEWWPCSLSWVSCSRLLHAEGKPTRPSIVGGSIDSDSVRNRVELPAQQQRQYTVRNEASHAKTDKDADTATQERGGRGAADQHIHVAVPMASMSSWFLSCTLVVRSRRVRPCRSSNVANPVTTSLQAETSSDFKVGPSIEVMMLKSPSCINKHLM